jgi:hypothetical protein
VAYLGAALGTGKPVHGGIRLAVDHYRCNDAINAGQAPIVGNRL